MNYIFWQDGNAFLYECGVLLSFLEKVERSYLELLQVV